MRRGPTILVLALLALTGCPSNKGHIREVTRPAPTAGPRQLRFELVETASVATGSRIELAVPLASSEPGVQVIERLDVTIKPDTPYQVTTDSRGNRTLRLVADAPLEVRVTYRVLRTRVDGERLEHRKLTDDERRALAPELAPSGDSIVDGDRIQGIPARAASGVRLDDRDGLRTGTAVDWTETWLPGVTWACHHGRPGRDPDLIELPESLLVVSHGFREALPVAKSSGAALSPQVDFTWRPLEP